MQKLQTPYYLIDERKIKRNLEIIRRVREESGAKAVLALKCFSTWSVFPLMRRYMDGTTSSGVYEARLGFEKFGGETHAFSVGYSRDDVREAAKYADKIIFNSLSQLKSLRKETKGIALGVRANPGFSHSHYDLADPARRFSRLGVSDTAALESASGLFSGLMFHLNCENDSFEALEKILNRISRKYRNLLPHMEWVSLGGGIAFTKPGYPVSRFCAALKNFSSKFGVQVYLEPGEAAITGAAELVSTVVDVVHNEKDIAIVDASTEAHMLDHLIYRTSPRLNSPKAGKNEVIIAGRTCLAGDVFGTYRTAGKLKVGSVVRFADAAGYTMVKKNWFNGLPMPSICVRRLNGKLDMVQSFGYKRFVSSLS